MNEHLVHALADRREGVGEEIGCGALVGRRPARAAVLAPEDARCGDPDVHLLGTQRIELDRMAAHAARPRVPAVARLMVHQALDRLPVRTAVVRAKEDARRAAEPEPAVFAVAARLDVPGLFEREPALLAGVELRVEDLPPDEMWALERPIAALVSCDEDEEAFPGADQDPDHQT